MTCPHCGYEADPGQAACPLCNTALESGGAAGTERDGEPEADAGGGRTGPGRAAAPGPAGGIAWEVRGGVGGLFASWWGSLTDPTRFFDRVEWNGGLERPLLYYLLFMVFGAGFQSLWSALLTPVLLSALGAEDLLAVSGRGSHLLQFFLSPFEALLWLGVVAGAVHAGARLVCERARSLRASTRVVCYAAGPQVLQVVPLIGGLAALAWSAVLALTGLRAAHRTSTARAAGALGLAFVVVTAFLSGLAVLLLGTGAVGSLPLP